MTLPGEVWCIDAKEAHCLLTAFEEQSKRMFNQESGSFEIWQNVLGGVGGAIKAAPTDSDRLLFEILIIGESERLTKVFDVVERLPCGHTVGEHEEVLRSWLNREIEWPKQFASSRQAQARLPPQERLSIENPQQVGLPVEVGLSGGIRLTRQDAEAGIARELEEIRERLVAGNPAVIRSMVEAGAPERFDWKKFAEGLNRGHEVTLADAEKQLWALLEKHIIG